MEPSSYRKVKKRIKKKKDFYQHLNTYLAIGVFFFVLNSLTSFGRWWFYWPMFGWGLGLFFHYLDTFGMPFSGPLDEAWEEKQLQRELKKRGVERLDLEELPDKEEAGLREEVQKPWKDEDLV